MALAEQKHDLSSIHSGWGRDCSSRTLRTCTSKSVRNQGKFDAGQNQSIEQVVQIY